MPGYVEFPFSEDADLTTREILTSFMQRWPGWTPREGSLEVAEAEEYGRVASEIKSLVVDVAAAAFVTIGTKLHGYPKMQGIKATVPVAIAFSRSGIRLESGFRAYGTTTNGDEVAFQLVNPLIIRSDMASPVTVQMQAENVGERYNDLPADEMTIATVAAYVTSVTSLAVSAGGVDPETDDEYVDRLTQYLSTLGGALVLPEDYAIRSRDVVGVRRALAVDGYDANNGTSNNARTITVFPVDIDGLPVSSAVASELRLYLASQREINFRVRVANPTYTPVTVTFDAVADIGYMASEVRTAIIERAYEVLSPANFSGGDESPPTWRNDKVIRYLSLSRELGNVAGVAFLRELTINGTEDDVTLPGVASLPAARTAITPTVVTGTVT